MINILKIYQVFGTIVLADCFYGSGTAKQVP